MHIISSDVDSKNPSDDMCRFRGKLKAMVIKVLLVYRVDPFKATTFVNEIDKSISRLELKCRNTLSQGKARLAPVDGRLGRRSFKTVPNAIRFYCSQYLLQTIASRIGVDIILGAHSLPASHSCSSSATSDQQTEMLIDEVLVRVESINARIEKLLSSQPAKKNK